MNDKASKFVENYLPTYKKLTIETGEAWWKSSITGKEEDFKHRTDLEKQLVDLHSDTEKFAQIESLYQKRSEIESAQLRRTIEQIYFAYLPNQVPETISKKIVELESDVEQIFNTHRSNVDGKELSENDVRKILSHSKDSSEAKKAWVGYMDVGKKIAPKLKELVGLRNQVATLRGFKNYFEMRMEMQELNTSRLFKLFDELDSLTGPIFKKLKDELDEKMSKRFNIQKSELRPWHTGDLFFQDAPNELTTEDMDEMVKKFDPVEVCRRFYSSLGFEVGKILERSDLYEKPGKSPHAFCTSIDRHQDVRILTNIKQNMYWHQTTIHELGHAIYDSYIAESVPFILHTHSHILTTEGIAMLFGSFPKVPKFLEVMGLSGDDLKKYAPAALQSLIAEKLIFSRWTQVMLRFEESMYRNPDQDLQALWWKLKKQYQLLNENDAHQSNSADYAAKLHVVAAPVYYHNYMMGDLFASQVWSHVAKTFDHSKPFETCFNGEKAKQIGDYFKSKIFAPGNTMNWEQLTIHATHHELSAISFAEMFVK